jgi:hypothetical protein
MNLTINPAQVRHWCVFCPDLILEVEDAATAPDLKDPLGEQGFAHVDCASANGHEVDAPQPDPADARYAIRQASREQATTGEPPDGTILADTDVSEAWVRDDKSAGARRWPVTGAHWYLIDGQGGGDGPVTWADVPEDVRNGVRLVVARESNEPAEVEG